jgi:ribosomal protein L11 methyltransferase
MSVPARWWVVEARDPSGEPDDGRLTEALIALGGRAVQESDGWLLTHLDPERVAGGDEAWLEAELRRSSGLNEVEVRTGWQVQEDWAELWKRGLGPRRVGHRLVVTPSWCEPGAAPDDLVLVLDPGMAFGNAEHGTTRGCLRLLEGLVGPGDHVLDVGAGSAVLSIAAALLGAGSVDALEADPWAVEPARENVVANGVVDRVRVTEVRADVASLASSGPYDGAVANIEAGVLEPLLPGFAQAVRPGGWLVLSGLLADQLDRIAEVAGRHGFRLEGTDEDGEWTSAAFRR